MVVIHALLLGSYRKSKTLCTSTQKCFKWYICSSNSICWYIENKRSFGLNFEEQNFFSTLYPALFFISCHCMSKDLYAYILREAPSPYFITFMFLGPPCTLTSLSFLRRNLPAPLHLFWAWRTFSDMSRILWTLCLSWSFFSQPTWTSSTNTWSDTLSSARPAFARAYSQRCKGDNLKNDSHKIFFTIQDKHLFYITYFKFYKTEKRQLDAYGKLTKYGYFEPR